LHIQSQNRRAPDNAQSLLKTRLVRSPYERTGDKSRDKSDAGTLKCKNRGCGERRWTRVVDLCPNRRASDEAEASADPSSDRGVFHAMRALCLSEHARCIGTWG